MTSLPETPERPGWITFSAMLMFAVSFVRLITAIQYFGHGIQVANLTGTLFGNRLWVYGVWDLALALLSLLAGLSLLVGGGFGRVLGYIWAIWVIVQSFLIIGWAPWFSIAMIGLGVLVLVALVHTTAEEDWQ